jgi:hypothetical protein
MAVPHAVVLVLALVALVALPCLVAVLVMNADRWAAARRRDSQRRESRRRRRRESRRRRGRIWRISPGRSSWQERWLMLRLERALAGAPAEQRFVLDAMRRSTQPPIEQIASDLRRLGRQRLGLATRNPIWHEAVRRAYDDRLRLACDCLGIRHHLTELDGLDLEIERLRVEGELRAAGLFFGAGGRERRQDRR